MSAAARPVARPLGLTVAILLIRLSLTLALTFALVLATGVVAYAAFHGAYRDRIYPGVSAWGVDLSGMTLPQAAEALSAAFTYPQAEVFTFRAAERVWSATPAQLGVNFDLPGTVARAYAIGRSGNLTTDLGQQFDAWYNGHSISPIMVYDPGRARAYLENIALEVDRPLIEAVLGIDGSEVAVRIGQVGRELDVDAVLPRLTSPISTLAGAEILLVIHEFTPDILDPSAQAEVARRILAEPLTLTVPDAAERASPRTDPGPWVFDQQTLADLLVIQRVSDASGARYEVGLDPVRLEAFLSELAPDLARQPRNARFIFNDDTRELDLLEPAIIGRELDIPATIQSINTLTPQGQHEIPLIFQVNPPLATDETTAAELGITEAVSVQSTYFTGSSKARIQNITVAASNFHGLLVAPGETFSMVANMEDISLDSGYAEALIIFGDRTIKGVGGGVCQVSTTLFRTAFFGGFQIDQRYSHAYRVGYYEQGRGSPGPGLDATVYQPLVDFKFTNDSPYWILMETYVYPASSQLLWKFYSTDDGRTVEVSRPEIKNVVEAPPPRYEENPELAQGEVRQVDYEVDGMDVTVYRTVTRDGLVLHEDAIRTHYLPWQAVYQYGPGTEVPTPAPEETS